MKRPLHTLIAIGALLAFLASTAAQDRRGLEVAARQIGEVAPGRQIVLLIAVNKYQEWTPLKNPVKDAREIGQVLRGRYYIDEVVELYDEDATKANILRRFNALTAELKPEDSLFIYYAGHGHLDQGSTSAFWIPVDAGTDKFAQANWIPNSQIRGFIANMKARHIALVSDSCFSGDILNASRAALPDITDEYFRNAYARRSRQVLTSGASETVPDESSFSRALKLALEENRKPYLDPLMIFSEVRLSVRGTTPLLGTLNSTDHQEGGSFILFLRPQAEAQADAPPTAPGAAPSAKSGELMVVASIAGARILVDGEAKGTAPLLIQQLPSGRSLKVEARSGTMGASAEVSLKPGELRELSLTLAELTGNIVILGAESSMKLRVDQEERGALGSGVVRDLSSGEHRVELESEGLYWSASIGVKGEETSRVEAAPWPVGWIEFAGAPEGAAFRLEGQPSVSGPAAGKARNIRIGKDRLILSAPGHVEKTVEVEIAAGKATWVNAALVSRGAASILLPLLDAEVELVVDGAPMKGEEDSAGRLRFDGIPSGRNVKIGFRVAEAAASGIPERDMLLEEGQSVALELPSGRFSLPSLAEGAGVAIGGRPIPVAQTGPFISPLLPAGSYLVEITGKRPFSGRVDISGGKTAELPGYREAALVALAGEKADAELSIVYRRNRRTLGWVSLGAGVLGAAGSAAAYYLGAEAGRDYEAALDSASAGEARRRLELFGYLFPIGASVGGLGLGLAPALLFGGPDHAALERSIDELNRQIESLEE